MGYEDLPGCRLYNEMVKEGLCWVQPCVGPGLGRDPRVGKATKRAEGSTVLLFLCVYHL